MYREIEFRGKDKDGDWFLGGYHKDGNKIYIVQKGIREDACNIDVVIPETVGQYTGLKDKNGVKIFEGDIINTKSKQGKVRVSFRGGRFVACDKSSSVTTLVNFTANNTFECEVIGNIHDTPELLEGK